MTAFRTRLTSAIDRTEIAHSALSSRVLCRYLPSFAPPSITVNPISLIFRQLCTILLLQSKAIFR